MTPDIEKCDCKEMSCKIGCDRRHTHKTFDCGICKPDTKKNESCTDPLHNIKHDELGGLSYHEYEEKLDKTMTSFTPDIEEIVKEAVKSVTRDDDGLLDIGKHDHKMLADLIRKALTSRDTYWKERVRKEVTDAIVAFECGCEHCHNRAGIAISRLINKALDLDNLK